MISNKAMPGLVKIGFSTKDPELRAAELNHTGSPHPYSVEYELLIENPYQIEQKTHKHLSANREAKEWFRCSPEEAVSAIKQVAGNGIITETYKRAEREKSEQLYWQSVYRKQDEEKQKKLVENAEIVVSELESSIRNRYKIEMEATSSSFYWYWAGSSFGVWIMFAMFAKNPENIGVYIMSAIVGAIAATFWKDHVEAGRKKPIESRMTAEVDAMRNPVMSCGKCGKKVRFNRVQMISTKNLSWNCPSCKGKLTPPV